MSLQPEIFATSIIAVGSFNPAIFTPEWLERHGLIGRDDAESVREDSTSQLVVTHQIAKFETKWFQLQVVGNQFSLTSKEAMLPAVRDLAVAIFQLVTHTPVTAIGLNYLAHYRMASSEVYHAIGDAYAPKEIWHKLFPGKVVGVVDLAIRLYDGTREKLDSVSNFRQITIQPSGKILHNGVFLAYNHHATIDSHDDDQVGPGAKAAAFIDECWEPSWKDAMRVFDGVLSPVPGVTS